MGSQVFFSGALSVVQSSLPAALEQSGGSHTPSRPKAWRGLWTQQGRGSRPCWGGKGCGLRAGSRSETWAEESLNVRGGVLL